MQREIMEPLLIENLDALSALIDREVAVSPWLDMEQSRVDAFAEVTEDRQWIHIDPARAKAESPFGAPVAHGFLTLSLLPRLIQSSFRIGDVRMAVNYGLNKVRFISPVKVGSRLRARFTLQSAAAIDGGMQVVWLATIEIEGNGKPACVAELVSRSYR